MIDRPESVAEAVRALNPIVVDPFTASQSSRTPVVFAAVLMLPFSVLLVGAHGRDGGAVSRDGDAGGSGV